jgi:Holliday junction resolvasome RuvABC DNA-binding subunit
LCVELKDFVSALGTASGTSDPGRSGLPTISLSTPNPRRDAVQALVALGYKLDAADRAVRQARERLGDDVTTEELIKASLR